MMNPCLLKSMTTMLITILLWSKVGAVDEGNRTDKGVGIYIYKSTADYEDHIKNFVEAYNGAHYYVQGHYTSDYWNAIGTIDLSEARMRLRTKDNNNRIPCISLNVISQIPKRDKYGNLEYDEKGNQKWDPRTLDIGIENEGHGWFPFFWSANWPHESSNSKKLTYPGARKVLFSIDAKIQNGYDMVIGHFIFYDQYNQVLGTETLTFAKKEDEFFSQDGNGHPVLRFGRFMSLLPHGANNTPERDVRDYTYMRGIKFTGLQLYNRKLSGYELWNWDKIAYAWSAQTANIRNLEISPNDSPTDTIYIYHSYDYHGNSV